MRIRSIDDLEALRKEGINRLRPGRMRVNVGTATCGMATGAEKVYIAIQEEARRFDGKIVVARTGCLGFCQMEPIVDVVLPDGLRIVYHEMTEEKARDLMEALADCYFMRRVPPAWFRPGIERHDFLIKLAKDFNVDGVIWYQLMYRESYKTESYYFPDIVNRETGLSMLTLESDYDAAEVGQMRTRVETFIESIRR